MIQNHRQRNWRASSTTQQKQQQCDGEAMTGAFWTHGGGPGAAMPAQQAAGEERRRQFPGGAQDGSQGLGRQQRGSDRLMSMGRVQPNAAHSYNGRSACAPATMNMPRVAEHAYTIEDVCAKLFQQAQALESLKQREEALQQERNTLEKERDSWAGICSTALASMKGLEAEVELEKRRQTEHCAKMKCSLQAHATLLLQKDAGLSALRLQLAHVEKGKRDCLMEKQQQEKDAAAAMDSLKKEVDGKVSALRSLQVAILEKVSALTADMKAFQVVLCGTVETNAAKDVKNTRDEGHLQEKCPQVFSSTPVIGNKAQDKPDGLWELELVVENLVKETELVQLVMTQVAKDWKQAAQKRLEPARVVVMKKHKPTDERGLTFDAACNDPQVKKEMDEVADAEHRCRSCGDVIADLNVRVAELKDECRLLGEERSAQAALDECCKDGSSGKGPSQQADKSKRKNVPCEPNLSTHPKSLEVSAKAKVKGKRKKARQLKICRACGQLGHMRTNKLCPLYMEEGEAVAWCDETFCGKRKREPNALVHIPKTTE